MSKSQTSEPVPSSTMTSYKSLVRQNFQTETEDMINHIINLCYNARYNFVQISYCFECDEVALYGFSQLFRALAKGMKICTRKLMCYQVQRGGTVVLDTIKKPENTSWNIVEALEMVLTRAKQLNEQFLKCHDLAEKNNDANLEDFLEHNFIHPLVVYMQKIAFYITKARRVTQQQSGLGEYIFDMDLIRENDFSIEKYSVTKHKTENVPTVNLPKAQNLLPFNWQLLQNPLWSTSTGLFKHK
jgi:ferritin heavy chain